MTALYGDIGCGVGSTAGQGAVSPFDCPTDATKHNETQRPTGDRGALVVDREIIT